MDIGNGKFYDLIDSKIEDEFYETEGINQKKFKRDSLIKLEIRKIRKYNLISKFKNDSVKYSNKNNDIKNNKKLIHQFSQTKINYFSSNKFKLTPFQKILKKSYQEKKKVEQIKLNNSPMKELDFILKNSYYENVTSGFQNNSNSKTIKTPLKKRNTSLKIKLHKPLNSCRSGIFNEVKLKKRKKLELFLTNMKTIKPEKKIKVNKISATMKFSNEGLKNKKYLTINREKISILGLYYSNSKKINDLKRIFD